MAKEKAENLAKVAKANKVAAQCKLEPVVDFIALMAEKSDFDGIDFTGVNMMGKDFRAKRFKNCNFEGTSFVDCNLQGWVLIDCIGKPNVVDCDTRFSQGL